MICMTGASRGKPAHTAARYRKTDQLLDEVEVVRFASRRASLARWEAEWIADGTLPGPNWLYQAVNERGENVGEPASFTEAMEAIWPNIWTDEPADGARIDPVGPAIAAGAATEAESA